MSYQDQLRAMRETYSQATNNAGSSVPDGKYNVIIDTMNIRPTPNQELRLVWDTIVTEGEHAGRHIFRGNRLVPDQSAMDWLKTDLRRAGAVLDDIARLEELLPELCGRRLQVTVAMRRDKRYQNVYIDRVLGTGDITKYRKQPAAGGQQPSRTPPTNLADVSIGDGDLEF